MSQSPAINKKMIDKEKSGMKSGNKSIRINGKSVEVTDEVYKVYGDNEATKDKKMESFAGLEGKIKIR